MPAGLIQDGKQAVRRSAGLDGGGPVQVAECEGAGADLDDAQTVADYLVGWPDAKARRLKPTTVAGYRSYLRNDLLPAFGAVLLERLSHRPQHES